MSVKLPPGKTSNTAAPPLPNASPNSLRVTGRSQSSTTTLKKGIAQLAAPKPVESSDSDPIVDFPTPPVQVATFRHAQTDMMIPLPRLSGTPAAEIPQLAFQKLKQCHRSCDFSDPSADLQNKILKTSVLHELIDLYSNQKMFPRLSRECHQAVIDMFAKNIFRPIPNLPHAILLFDDAKVQDTGWTHIQLVYELFIKFLDCPIDLRILQYQLTPRFISNLYAILDFPDERERMQMKAVIASIFNKVPPHRGNLRVIAANMLMCVPENLYITAALHLLELFYLFTMNVPSPLTPSHISQFDRVLLPLHLGFRSPRYFGPLIRCTMLMVRKDKQIGNNLMHFLITHWPLTLDHKAELFIKEVTQVLEIGVTECVKAHIADLLQCIAISIESQCTTLAEKALSFVLEDTVQHMLADDAANLFRIVFPALFRAAKSHWQSKIQLQALDAMSVLMALNQDVFAQTAAEFKEQSLAEQERNSAHKLQWAAVVRTAAANYELVDVDGLERKLALFFEPGMPIAGGRNRREAKAPKPAQLPGLE